MLNSIYISWIIRRRRQKRRSWKKSLKMEAERSGQRRSSVKDGKISHFRWYSNNLINFYCHTLYVQYNGLLMMMEHVVLSLLIMNHSCHPLKKLPIKNKQAPIAWFILCQVKLYWSFFRMGATNTPPWCHLNLN